MSFWSYGIFLHITNRDIFQRNCLHSVQYCRCCRLDFDSVSARLPCHMSDDPLKRDFLDIYLTTFFGVHNFKMTSYFFWKCSKLNLNLENPKTDSENIFPFWDNCIWKSCNKLSLLRKEYLLSAPNGLTNSPKILHITQRDFFKLNFVHRDQ